MSKPSCKLKEGDFLTIHVISSVVVHIFGIRCLLTVLTGLGMWQYAISKSNRAEKMVVEDNQLFKTRLLVIEELQRRREVLGFLFWQRTIV